MSEQNPYAPVGTPGMIAPPGPAMIPPQGFAPPPVQGFAPAPAHSYEHPAMTLTELSFAPTPTDTAPAPVELPPPALPLVNNVLPSGGVARRLSMGGRTPLLALILVLLLGAAGAVFGPGLLKSKDSAPSPIPKKKAATPAPTASSSAKPVVVAPAKPKPVVKALVGKPISVTAANSGTFGGAYTVTVPTGWTAKFKQGRDTTSNGDLVMADAKSSQLFSLASAQPTFAKGSLTAAKLAMLKASVLKDTPGAKALPGEVKATIAGAGATGFDATATLSGKAFTVRTLFFEHGGVVYVAVWATSPATFSASVPTFNQLLASVKFAK